MASPIWLKKRSDFLKVQSGKRYRSSLFVLCSHKNNNAAQQGLRFGITVTKKQGHAVDRNKIRRRLKALLHEFHKDHMLINHSAMTSMSTDVVVIGHSGILPQDYAALKTVLFRALNRALDLTHDRPVGIDDKGQQSQFSS